MKKSICFLLIVLMLLSAGCTGKKETSSASSKTPKNPRPSSSKSEPVQTAPPRKPEAEPTKPAPTVPPAEPETEPVDVIATATPTVPEGMCKVCGLDRGDYDGYCYYCHPDFLFTCAICGYEQPYHRPENGLCYECDAAQRAVDATTGATG